MTFSHFMRAAKKMNSGAPSRFDQRHTRAQERGRGYTGPCKHYEISGKKGKERTGCKGPDAKDPTQEKGKGTGQT